jgi:hypothetical protein
VPNLALGGFLGVFRLRLKRFPRDSCNYRLGGASQNTSHFCFLLNFISQIAPKINKKSAPTRSLPSRSCAFMVAFIGGKMLH